MQGAVLRLFLRVVERCLREHSPGCGAAARIGAVVFIHRFGASLNEHLHFHCCIVDGIFAPAVDADGAVGVVFHAAAGLDALAIAGVQALVRRRVLSAFVRRGLIDHRPKPRPNGPSALVLTPLALIGKIAALVPPPRTHRHRYCGVLAPNAPLRAAVTAPAPPPVAVVAAKAERRHRAVSRYLWAMLLARIDEAFPLTCPFCHAEMKIIAFINEASTVRKMLDHLGEATRPPRIAPAQGATAVGGSSGFRTGGQRPPMGPSSPTGTGGRIRSAQRLVTSNFCLVLNTLVRSAQGAAGVWC